MQDWDLHINALFAFVMKMKSPTVPQFQALAKIISNKFKFSTLEKKYH